MALNFLPGQPNCTQQTVCQSSWQDHTLLAYCSGNNLIILSNNFSRLQTIYFDHDCCAVAIDPSNGHIAVANGSKVTVYKPLHQVMRNPRWVYCTEVFHDDSTVNCVSWGLNKELAVGSDYLSFWKIRDEFGHFTPSLLWTKKQFHPVYRCAVSEDSQVIASVHKYSPTVRLWRRISLGDDRELFDLTLISHPGNVTSFRWKRSKNLCDQEKDSHVFYTLCEDGKLRIWTYFENNGRKTIQKWGSLELSPQKDQRFCFIIDSWLVQQALQGSKIPNLEYYSEIHPDMAVIANGHGQLEFHALENLSHNPPKLMSHQIVATTEVPPAVFVHEPKYLYFAEPQLAYVDKKGLSIVVHDVRGVLRHSQLRLENILEGHDSSSTTLLHKFTGHNKSIQKLVRSSNGKAMMTISRFTENCIWVPQNLSSGVSLRKKNIIVSEGPLLDAVVLESGNLVVTLSQNFKLQAWECPNDRASKKSQLKAEYKLDLSKGVPRLMLNMPEKVHHHDRHFVGLIYSSGEVLSFKVTFGGGIVPIPTNSLDLGQEKGIYLISSIDPVNYGFFAGRSLVSIISKSGIIRAFKCIIKDDSVFWKLSYCVDTNLNDSVLISGSSIDKICVVDRSGKRLTIWDLRRAFLEYEKAFENPVRDIDWTSTKFRETIFSAGFSDHVLLFTQQRYDYTSKIPSYAPVGEIGLKEHTTHAVGDSIWLTDGTFVVASGNQLFIKDKHLDMSDRLTNQSVGSRRILSNDIMHLSNVLNGPLPVYHPQLLIQALYTNKVKLVKEILLRLFLALRKLEFNSGEMLTLEATLGLPYEKFVCPNEEAYQADEYSEPYKAFSSLVASSLRDKLIKHALPFITRHQQVTLITVIEAIEEIDKNSEAVDAPGNLFILGVKLFELHRKTQASINVRDSLWALYSNSKRVLFSTILPTIDSWERGRQYKISFWAEREDLMASFDKIAKHEFTQGTDRDPRKSGLFYLTLKKKQILLSLWRVSAGHPEQQKMLKFLNNDFKEERWRKAALTNAFVLLSKHRFVDAACFFLLADSLKDAANVILKQMQDLALAVGVCRLYEGERGTVLCDLLKSAVLPQAIVDNDRWITSFIYHILGKPNIALKALVMSPINLESNNELVSQEDIIIKSFLVEDPALLMLYAHLKEKSDEYFSAYLEVDEGLEYRTVHRVSALYSRMGCDYLALSLVMNWQFPDKTRHGQEKQLQEKKWGASASPQHEHWQHKARSIFDKFDNIPHSAESTTQIGSLMPEAKNLLDQFGDSPRNPTTNSSGLFSMECDGFTSATTPASIKSEATTEAMNSPPTQPTKPRNLLDDFF
ncbi:LADA_0H18096g1_1 [Lachancea dasiensis]|uniref:LADA_0H18096g1_1 n=1 Tax=Lachancea dasiensis TaxID=1072105 RepID=A0A1G4K5U6_9SACH|nr:LADA_0H18096g1_1 [Lachancea dasiensis]